MKKTYKTKPRVSVRTKTVQAKPIHETHGRVIVLVVLLIAIILTSFWIPTL